MITYSLDQSQLDRLLAIANPKQFQDAINIALKSIGLEMQRDAANLAPYLTGNLRRSIVIGEQTNVRVQVGTDLDYAMIHEFGGRTRNGGLIQEKRYLRGALETQQSGRAAELLSKEINRLFK